VLLIIHLIIALLIESAIKHELFISAFFESAIKPMLYISVFCLECYQKQIKNMQNADFDSTLVKTLL
jgi:hypothetical protein